MNLSEYQEHPLEEYERRKYHFEEYHQPSLTEELHSFKRKIKDYSEGKTSFFGCCISYWHIIKYII